MCKQDNQYKTVTVYSTGTERRLGVTRWEAAAWDFSHSENWTRVEKQGPWGGVLWGPN